MCDHIFPSAAAPAEPCDHISPERRYERRRGDHISFRAARTPARSCDIAYHNKRVVYDPLMKAAAETTLAIAADQKRLGARIRWRSSRRNFPTRRAALRFFLHDAGRTGLFVRRAAGDALWP